MCIYAEEHPHSKQTEIGGAFRLTQSIARCIDNQQRSLALREGEIESLRMIVYVIDDQKYCIESFAAEGKVFAARRRQSITCKARERAFT